LIPSQQSNYEYRIDIIRAVACGIVALVHISVPNWTKPLLVKPNIIEEIFLRIVECGWLGVPIFLFISGYSLALNKFDTSKNINLFQFAVNRILRIYPAYFVVLVLLSVNHKINGETAILLFFFQLQNIPSSTAFNIAWSMQLEMACYLFYPIFMFMIRRSWVAIIWSMLFFIFIRLYLGYHATGHMFNISYGSVLGGANLFALGMLAAKLPKLQRTRATDFSTILGVIMMVAFCYIVSKNGNYYGAQGNVVKGLILFLPEYIGLSLMLITYGFLRIQYENKPSIIAQPFIFFGRVSYSAYLFSLFTHDFVHRLYYPDPGTWVAYLSFVCVYLIFLTILAALSFYGIEKPFLDLRKSYLR